MISRQRLSFIRSLQQKKFRQENRLFIAEGAKLVHEFLASDFAVEEIYSLDPSFTADAVAVGEKEMKSMSALTTPPGVLAVIRIPDVKFDPAAVAGDWSLFLDGIRDPGNMGTIIRAADWFGVKNIICSGDCAETWNPKVVQASMGSLTRVSVHSRDAHDFFPLMKSALPGDVLPVYGTFMDGK
ncbi:MAG TPA: RNA methyltransferase, partial [Bacteroidia bacterium]|nr:RNA methyltransferase [Bacteroidia bacterium]